MHMTFDIRKILFIPKKWVRGGWIGIRERDEMLPVLPDSHFRIKDKARISQFISSFGIVEQQIKCENMNDQVDVWFARVLMGGLGYTRWENFQLAINRAVDSCRAQNINVYEHFREVTKKVEVGSVAKREIIDYMLTRYARYLIAQNGDPKKDGIAFAQSYCTVQTRKGQRRHMLTLVSQLRRNISNEQKISQLLRCSLKAKGCRHIDSRWNHSEIIAGSSKERPFRISSILINNKLLHHEF